MNENLGAQGDYKEHENENEYPSESKEWDDKGDDIEKKLDDEEKKTDLVYKIKALLSDLALYMRYDKPDFSTLLKLDWTSIRLDANIDHTLEKYNIPNVLLRLFQCSYSPIVILSLRITNFLCRNSLNLLEFMLDNVTKYIHLIRAPQFFPLICELIDGFCTYFSDAPKKLQESTRIIDILCQLSSSMTPDYISIACYIITQIISNLDPDDFEDFGEIIKGPLFIVNKFISYIGTDVISQFNLTHLLSSSLNVISAILQIFCGDIKVILDEELFSNIVQLTLTWDSYDNTGFVYEEALKFWNILMYSYKDFFDETDVIQPLIQTIVRTFKHPNCPLRRVLFTLGNIATFDGANHVLIPTRIIQKCWKRIESYDNIEKELFMFLFLNCSLLSPREVIAIEVFGDIIIESFEMYSASVSDDYRPLFIRALDCLLFTDEGSITSIIDREDSEPVFLDAANSEDEEIATLSQKILETYFPDDMDDQI